jgi:TonB-linked SusC/RagA family outer membrane protein
MLNSNYKRFSFRMNSEYKFNSKITVGLSLAPTYSMNATPNSDGNIFSGGIIQGAITTSPIAPAINPDGSLPLQATSAGLFPNPNWYRVVQEVTNETKVGNILSNAYINIEVLKDLNFKSSVNVQYTNSQNNYFSPSTAGALFSPPPRPATASNTNSTYYTWLTENTLTYKHSFGDHNFDVLAGYTAQKYHMDYGKVTGTNFPNDRLPSLNNASQYTVNYDPTQNLQEWALLSFISRINYNYKGKYLLSASYRRDGSSRFAANTKYGNFPAISAGWNVSDESFMSDLPLISTLKLRAGYGLNGNFDIGNYTYSANTINTNYPFGNTQYSGASIGNIGNRNLSWEKSNQLDIGADIGILNNRIFFTYDYFRKFTTSMLLDINVPDESGYASATGNVGKFRFTGHEFSVNTRNLVGQLKWSTNFNISFIRSRVMNLGPYKDNLPRRDAHGPSITAVGQPVSMFYGYTYLGVFMTQQDFDSYPHLPRSMVGSAKLADRNHDGQISEADEGIIGNPNPKFIYGMTNTFSYRNFDLGIVISGSYGNQIMNRTYEYTRNLDGVFNVTKDVARRWKSLADPGDGIIPKTQSGGSERETNTLWIRNASYLTVKNVTLGYTLPIRKTDYISSLRLYASIQQAWVFTGYNGANPEVNDSGTYGVNNSLIQGVDYTSYPVPRTMSLGINVNFK